MNQFERAVLVRFGRTSLLIWALLCWLAVLSDAPRSLFRLGTGHVSGRLVITLYHLLDAAHLALVVAAPLGFCLVLMQLKKSGVLASFFAAGLAPARFSRLLLLAALATSAAALIVMEADLSVRAWAAPRRDACSFAAGDVMVWVPHCGGGPAGRETWLFRYDGLEVSRGTARATGSVVYEIVGLEAVSGPKIQTRRFSARPNQDRLLFPPPVLSWFRHPPRLEQVLTTLNGVIAAAVLLLLTAYLAILAPLDLQPYLPVAFLFIAPAVGIGMVWSSIRLWVGGPAAIAVEAGWLVLLAAVMIALEMRLRRRGPGMY